MHIVVDLLGAQAENGRRGIGRYSLALARAIGLGSRGHRITLALSDAFPAAVDVIRKEFRGILPEVQIRVWKAPRGVALRDGGDTALRRSAALLRECFLHSLRPDIVLVTSLFEGLVDDAVVTIDETPKAWPTAVVLYDLIPLAFEKEYLRDPVVNRWYRGQLDHLKRADLLLCISRSTLREAEDFFGGAHKVTAAPIFAGSAPQFCPVSTAENVDDGLRSEFGISKPFVMYTGGMDPRKNVAGVVRAFGLLSERLRNANQLVVVCAIQENDRRSLLDVAAAAGLSPGQLVITGYVSEDRLVNLYNRASLFVFPSLHEGFGLPALEAMACGCPVIGSDTSSLPEVLGREDVLFDPRSDEAIAEKMELVLRSESLRRELRAHGLEQAKRFTWERCAEIAVSELERCCQHWQAANQKARTRPKLRLAYISPIPPAKSGIADYSANLVSALSEHYEIDVVTEQENVDYTSVPSGCRVVSSGEFVNRAGEYQRVLYHFGNSEFHSFMFSMLRRQPGVVVLHDFYLSGVLAYMEGADPQGLCWTNELYESHGYHALIERYSAVDSAETVWKYPCSLSTIQQSVGVVVHSPHAVTLASDWYGRGSGDDWAVIPSLRTATLKSDKATARRELSIDPADFVVCAFGLLGPTKLNQELVRAWTNSSLASDPRCRLVFVGENAPGNYAEELLQLIGNARSGSITITGWIDDDAFGRFLSAADVAVQLRSLSRGETSAAVLHCMSQGLPTIVNANGSMADLDHGAVWKLPDSFTEYQLIEALEKLRQDEDARSRIGASGRELIRQRHDPKQCASMYRDHLERFYTATPGSLGGFVSTVCDLERNDFTDTEIEKVAEAGAITLPPRNKVRQLLVDVSELVQRDSASGIQRVVRNVLWEWLLHPPPGLRVEPVYSTEGGSGYRYARKFALQFLGVENVCLADDPIEYSQGDVFIGLDLQPRLIPTQVPFLEEMRCHGVLVKFVVYDLLPITLPEAFPPEASSQNLKWLKAITQFDGAICISKSVGRELQRWIDQHFYDGATDFEIQTFVLGDQIGDAPKRLPFQEDSALPPSSTAPTFLMVGTLEPRKGYSLVIEAFNRAWNAGRDWRLVIVGKQGWMVEGLVDQIRSHPERAKKLYWLEAAGDDQLLRLYGLCDCLIAASEGEGFGLPIVEASRHGLPILARDIPVFREVAGEHATFFSASDPADLVSAIVAWLELKRAGTLPDPERISRITWAESARQLLSTTLSDARGAR